MPGCSSIFYPIENLYWAIACSIDSSVFENVKLAKLIIGNNTLSDSIFFISLFFYCSRSNK